MGEGNLGSVPDRIRYTAAVISGQRQTEALNVKEAWER